MAPTVLVTGATGAVGPSVVQALHAAGYQVRILTRSVPQSGVFPHGVDVCLGDITDLATVQAAMQGISSVMHLAALLHIMNPPPAWHERYERVNVEGTATVVRAAVAACSSRLVFFSTIAVYGQAAGQVLTEETTPHPDTFYAHTKLTAERIVLDATRFDGEPLGTVLRLGAVYGPRMKGNYHRLVRSLARRRFMAIGNGQNRRTLVYEKDVASAAVLAAHHPRAGGQIYNVSDGQYSTLHDIIVAICHALGRTPPRHALPAGLARLAAGLVEDIGRLMSCTVPIGRATIDKYIEDIAVSSQRIQTHLGFVPQIDLATGWRQTILAMRQNGEL
ncbi:MAG: NAD-dependent epimerase/dehydratase family protein [Candidatus Tectimicrobiota bacterium]